MFHRQFSSTSHRTVISAPSYYPAEVTLINCLRVCKLQSESHKGKPILATFASMVG
eukprot:COSAG02_NODE_3564_length_6552_cov_5.292112_1_plen_56_part_00